MKKKAWVVYYCYILEKYVVVKARPNCIKNTSSIPVTFPMESLYFMWLLILASLKDFPYFWESVPWIWPVEGNRCSGVSIFFIARWEILCDFYTVLCSRVCHFILEMVLSWRLFKKQQNKEKLCFSISSWKQETKNSPKDCFLYQEKRNTDQGGVVVGKEYVNTLISSASRDKSDISKGCFLLLKLRQRYSSINYFWGFIHFWNFLLREI